MGERVLVSTLPLWPGGVLSMVRFALECLEKEGLEPVLAYYLPYSIDPSLSVRLPGALLGRQPGMRQRTRFEQYEAHELGASLPELEQRHYKLNAHWQELIDGCRYHMAISGSCLAARPFVDAGIPFFLWVATPWREDREDRIGGWPLHRKVFDRLFVQPGALHEEVRILRSADGVYALSDYCRRQLAPLAPGREIGVISGPVDAAVFSPRAEAVIPGRVAFIGRISDPRKNVLLFLQAIARGRANGTNLTGLLVGGELPAEANSFILRAGLSPHVQVISQSLPHVSPAGRASDESLSSLLATVDVFMVPSKQEGLCIAALEAMAAGCPVVSTRCGGPEEFVLEGETGFSTSFDPVEFSAAVSRIVGDRDLRNSLSRNARALIERRYDRGIVQARMREEIRKTLGVRPEPGRVHALGSGRPEEQGAAAG